MGPLMLYFASVFRPGQGWPVMQCCYRIVGVIVCGAWCRPAALCTVGICAGRLWASGLLTPIAIDLNITGLDHRWIAAIFPVVCAVRCEYDNPRCMILTCPA